MWCSEYTIDVEVPNIRIIFSRFSRAEAIVLVEIDVVSADKR